MHPGLLRTPPLTLVWQAKPRMISGRDPRASQEGLKAFTRAKGSPATATSCAERNTMVPTTTKMHETAAELTAAHGAGKAHSFADQWQASFRQRMLLAHHTPAACTPTACKAAAQLAPTAHRTCQRAQAAPES